MISGHVDRIRVLYKSIIYMVMGDTKNIDSITITTTFWTKYRSIDYSNDYLLCNSSNMLVISYKCFYTIKNIFNHFALFTEAVFLK